METKPALCGWCRKEPLEVTACRKPFVVEVYTCALACPNACLCASLEDWNAAQARILSARRRDFEAGRDNLSAWHDCHFRHSTFDAYLKEQGK
jgi:hypothetical protein